MATDKTKNIPIDLTDENAFESIFRVHYSSLAYFALKYVKDKELAEEIVQEMFTNIWDKAQDVSIQTSIQSYLFGAVRNACLNYLKHQKVKMAYAEQVKFSSNTQDLSDTLEFDELKRRLEGALDRLPEKCREVFEMSRFDGLKYKEIATELNISQKTVENQMGKALKILREELGDYLPVILWILNFYGGKI